MPHIQIQASHRWGGERQTNSDTFGRKPAGTMVRTVYYVEPSDQRKFETKYRHFRGYTQDRWWPFAETKKQHWEPKQGSTSYIGENYQRLALHLKTTSGEQSSRNPNRAEASRANSTGGKSRRLVCIYANLWRVILLANMWPDDDSFVDHNSKIKENKEEKIWTKREKCRKVY